MLVPIINWVSPASFTSGLLEQHAALASVCLHMSDHNAGVVLTPMFAHKSGQLWLLEHQVHKALVQRSCNIDKNFGLVFAQKVDARESHPLLYHGRFVHTQHIKMHEKAWKSSELFANGRTKEAKQLASKDMDMVEDLDPNALPSTTDDSAGGVVQGGKKYEQIGDDGAEKLVDALLSGLEFKERALIVLVDLTPLVGNFISAFFAARVKFQATPMFYFGVCSTHMHREWLERQTLSKLLKLFVADKFVIPGYTPKSAIPPESLLEAPPPKPSMNMMLWMKDVRDSPGMPQGIKFPESTLAKWYEHPKYGAEFKEFFDKVLEVCGVEEDSSK